MVKIVWMICIALLLAGCTGPQIRSVERALGTFKVIRIFPIDLSNTEKQIFQIRGIDKPSFWGRRSDGRITYHMDLCVDSIPNVSLDYVGGMEIHTKVSIEAFLKDDLLDRVGITSSTNCWYVDDSDGWYLSSFLLPPETDLEQLLTIEFQIMKSDSNGWNFYAKSHRTFPSGETPILKYHVRDGDTLALSKFKNPRLVIWTGE